MIYGALVFAAFGMTACGEQEAEEKNEETKEKKAEKVEYVLDKDATELGWVGSWVVPGEDGKMEEAKNHTGNVTISEGKMTVIGDDVKGSFTVDMSSIVVTDLEEEEGKGKLEGHLQSEDFFKVEDYAKVTVALNSLKDGVADITINVIGIEVNDKVEVETSMEGDKMMMHGEFAIDFAALSMPMTSPDPEKPEEGNVNPEIKFHLHAVLNKK